MGADWTTPWHAERVYYPDDSSPTEPVGGPLTHEEVAALEDVTCGTSETVGVARPGEIDERTIPNTLAMNGWPSQEEVLEAQRAVDAAYERGEREDG